MAEQEKLMGLLGLARRAGKLGVGFTAVQKMVRRGEQPLIIVAADIGASQLQKVSSWQPVRGLIQSGLPGGQLAAAMGREKLSVLGVSDNGFVAGIRKLGL